MSRTPLTIEEAKEIGGALHRLNEIGGSTIINPNAQVEAERAGLKNFLARIMVEHTDEFLACWLAVNQEYEPLIAGFVGLLTRANGVLNRRASQARVDTNPAGNNTATAPVPDNVVPLR